MSGMTRDRAARCRQSRKGIADMGYRGKGTHHRDSGLARQLSLVGYFIFDDQP